MRKIPLLAACLLAVVALVSAQETAATLDPLRIRRVTVVGTSVLSQAEMDEIGIQVRLSLDARNPDPTFDRIQASAGYVTEAYQNKGYWRVDGVTVKAVPVPDAPEGTVDLRFNVRHAGSQYRLQSVHWTHTTLFTDEQLLSVMPTQPGEIFSREKIAQGLEAARKLYGEMGYVNFTSIPITEVDDKNLSISLRLDADEGKLFHFGKLRLPGLDEAHAAELTRQWEAMKSQPYTESALRQFLDSVFRYPSGIDPVKSDGMTKDVDETHGTVNVSISFLPKPDLRPDAP